MVTVTITEKGGKPTVRKFDQPEITVGRVQGNDIVLPKSNVSKQHVRIVKSGNNFVVIDTKSTNGTFINGKRIAAPYDLRPGDKVFVGDFSIELRLEGDKAATTVSAKADKEAAGPHKTEGPKPSFQVRTKELSNPNYTGANSSNSVSGRVLLPPDPNGKAAQGMADAAADDWDAGEAELSAMGLDEVSMAHQEAVRLVQERMANQPGAQGAAGKDLEGEGLRTHVKSAAGVVVQAMHSTGELPEGVEINSLVDSVVSEAVGMGPLEGLLADPSVSEILVNGARQIFVERSGKLEPTDVSFSSNRALVSLIERIVAPLGRHIDANFPMVDARLRDGSRVNAVLPPLSLRGPTLTIRKFARDALQIDDLVAGGSLNADMAEFLEVCVQSRKNIVISGGTGSGKTTLLNVISSFIDSHERIITIEDAAELKLDQEHIVSLEARPADANGKGGVYIRDLVRNALRMRPDRIIVGECRGGEALDMLQAMNTGHDGSLTTVHANSPRDALSRMETMVLMSGMELPIRAIREQVQSAVDIIVQQTRFVDGTRRITHIAEIVGMETEIISMHDLFVFEQQGFTAEGRSHGRFKATGFVPKFYEPLRAFGLEPNLAIFRNT
jgi:pilus assembly protein CpaF